MTDLPPPPEKRDHRSEWWASYRRAAEHTNTFGLPRQRDKTPDGWAVGKWLAKQKERFATLSPEQEQALIDLPGFVLDSREAHFDTMVAACVQAREAGFSLGNKRTEYDGHPVGQWLHDLRRGRDNLTPERVVKLQAAQLL